VRIRNWDALAEVGDFSDEYLQLRIPAKGPLPLEQGLSEYV
jgi:hypothetical protein